MARREIDKYRMTEKTYLQIINTKGNSANVRCRNTATNLSWNYKKKLWKILFLIKLLVSGTFDNSNIIIIYILISRTFNNNEQQWFPENSKNFTRFNSLMVAFLAEKNTHITREFNILIWERNYEFKGGVLFL